ncbi:hypothetical protein COZ41_02490 [Candidatus Shapirobacteria bacterium CG_4_10_14_3_um_filter_35_13]|uniref:Bacterial Ig-like domain-containing protein n=1 Tax=Candidatus Shapirobacteria bacterium CG_4_10_14_3_um_filter_35_13 TaxID=1974873 RepID=A0A2M7LII8_9BACT|nr:MAG: hypothetical protein COZ41_02490 [Candidatus Shapirobacteria bacterium CG_4_10_14_3_um_filter_35_13]
MKYFLMKKLIILLFLMMLVFVNGVLAGGFNMTSIGEVDTSGRQISQWWYTSGNPTFRGEAASGGEVIYEIDGTSLQINADSAGNWVFTPQSALSSGDHAIKITSGGSEIAFTLTIGSENVNWDTVGKGGGGVLPAAGTSWPTVMLTFLGGGLMLVAKRMIR